jgi:hypothetical protein
MVNSIADATQRAGRDYAIMGDFNRDPASLDGRLRASAHIYRRAG